MVKRAATKKYSVKKKTVKTKSKKIAIVTSLFNDHITKKLEKGAYQTLIKNGYQDKHIFKVDVAGAFEIPFICQLLAKQKKFAGIIALGCVIKGETPHFDYVCQAVTQGCLRVQLDTHCPVSFGVVTTNNEKQAKDRSGNNKYNKGVEAVYALLHTLDTIDKIK
jgi:6,7-dimethyl-8-ribityllumazine synthase